MNSIAMYVMSEVLVGGKYFPFFWLPNIGQFSITPSFFSSSYCLMTHNAWLVHFRLQDNLGCLCLFADCCILDSSLHVTFTHSFLLMQNLVAIGLFVCMAFYMHTIKFYVKV
jgi:hypothetical protein